MATKAQVVKRLVAGSDQQLTQLEERLGELDAQVQELAALVKRLASDAERAVQATSAAQKAAEDAAKVTSLTRSLEAKYEALSRAVGEMKATLAKHGERLDGHYRALKARHEDTQACEKNFKIIGGEIRKANEWFHELDSRVNRLEEWIIKLHPERFRQRKRR